MVEKHLPHLYEDYRRICSMSEDARYGEGYAMGDKERQKARAIHVATDAAIIAVAAGDKERQKARAIYERISRAIPWP